MAKNCYIAKSRVSLEALKSANLLKSLSLNVIIIGEVGVGKKSLARYIYEDAFEVDASSLEKLVKAIESNERLIIKNFDQINNFDKVKNLLSKNKNRFIATSQKELSTKVEDSFFSLKMFIPPLRERSADVVALSEFFLSEVKEIFGDLSIDLNLKETDLDLSQNCYSLKKSIYKAYFKSLLSKDDMMKILEDILYKEIGTGNDYREFLYLFDIPLIKSGFKKFGSQLSMSKAFGLNRNTLRKKINEYGLEENKR
ncbi:MAG: sigma 54-interacting transcriptional regulator [Sulfurospirillum sp.]